MSTLQVWARYSPAPVVEEGTWASAVDNVSGHELADRYELYPERNGPGASPQKERSLALGFLMAGALVGFGAVRPPTAKRLHEEGWRFWKGR